MFLECNASTVDMIRCGSKEQLLKLSLLPMEGKSVADMQVFVKSEIGRWGKVVEAAGIAGSQ